jgi:hypothetical protein
MLFLAYLLFITIASAALLANAGGWGRFRAAVLRAFTGGLAASAGGVALALLTAGDGDHTTPAIVLLTTTVAGSLFYLSGLVLWRGKAAFVLRLFGWLLLVVPALVPSTLSLSLPILAILAVTVSLVRSADSTRLAGARRATG